MTTIQPITWLGKGSFPNKAWTNFHDLMSLGKAGLLLISFSFIFLSLLDLLPPSTISTLCPSFPLQACPTMPKVQLTSEYIRQMLDSPLGVSDSKAMMWCHLFLTHMVLKIRINIHLKFLVFRGKDTLLCIILENGLHLCQRLFS